ncbi:MAG: hypothetical protein ACI4GY_08860 [Acutalibacteraceae bacterium]
MDWKEILDFVFSCVVDLVSYISKISSAKDQETLDIIDAVGELVLDGADIILSSK